MATFYDNLRNSSAPIQLVNLVPNFHKVPNAEDQSRFFQRDTDEHREAQQKINKAVKETEPLRSVIKDASDGKVMVDDSIYNEKELQRILDTVQKMKKYNNGVLFPGYTIISNSDGPNAIEYSGEFHYGAPLNLFGFSSLPNGNYGTKNNPYKIYIRHANDTQWNDDAASEGIEYEWHPKTGETAQNTTQTHELSHSAHKEALKKSHPPTLWMSPEEDEAYKNLIAKFSTFQDLVQQLTNEYHLENTKNAAASVSGYAEYSHDGDSTDKKFPFAEMFAEAYTDVLYNGDSAKPYSKALVDTYSEYLNEYNSIFDNDVNRIRRQFNNNNNFVDNLRNYSPKFNSGRYIVK